MRSIQTAHILGAGFLVAAFSLSSMAAETRVAAQPEPNACVASLPKELTARLGAAYKGWRVLELSDLVADDQAIWKQTWDAKSCPGVATGNFKGTGTASYAIALIHQADSARSEKLILADKSGGTYRLTELYSENIVSNFAVVRKGPPGQYKDFYDRTKPITIRTDTAIYEHIEASAIAFYAKGNVFEKVLISD